MASSRCLTFTDVDGKTITSCETSRSEAPTTTAPIVPPQTSASPTSTITSKSSKSAGPTPESSFTASASEFALSSSLSSAHTDSSANADSTAPAQQSPDATSSYSNSKSSSNSLSAGTVAGIAVATAIAGAIIALGFACFFFRRRDNYRSRRRYRSSSSRRRGSIPEKVSNRDQPAFDLTNLTGSSDFLGSVLAQPADDKTTHDKVLWMFDQIQLHVENFYSNLNSKPTPAIEGNLSRFGSPTLSEPFAALLIRSSRPTILIKHALTFYLLDVSTDCAQSDRSILSPDMAFMPARISKAATESIESREFNGTYILWRMLTAHIHRHVTLPDDAHIQNINAVAQHFSQTFGPWANSRPGREENLASVVRGAAELATFLYSQPFLYEYDWCSRKTADDRPRTLVVTPELRKVTDLKGEALAQRQTILKATFAQLQE